MSVHVFGSFPHPSSVPIYPFPGPQGTTFLKAPNSHLCHPGRSLLTLPRPFPKALELGIFPFLTSRILFFRSIPISSKSRKEGLPHTKAENVGNLPTILGSPGPSK